MANKDVETKVVQMRFDNQKFEKNIQTTIKSTEKLDKTLQFKGSKKGLEDLSKSLDKLDTSKLDKDLRNLDKDTQNISISLKQLLKIKLLSKVIDTVTRKTVNMIKSMTGINNVVAGWDAYNESLTVTGGILNQIQGKMKADGGVYGLEDVADSMEKLRWYADETSYSFQTMSDGIRQFTIAGIDLQKATSAVQGVANLAGSAKVFDSYKVQSAMDAISKSMQTGYMDTLKWTTLTNTAGVVTTEFSEKLLEAAAAQGTLIKDQVGQYKTKRGGKLVTTENIRDTLSQRWLTSNVLTTVLNEYNSATETVKGFMVAVEEGSEEAWAAVNDNFKKTGKEFHSLDDAIAEVQSNPEKYDESIVQMTKDMDASNLTTRQAAKLLKALGAEFDEVSYKAFMSSQETTSFSQAISYVGTAIKTSWQGVFQSMFGDVEKSTELWSDVSDKFYGIFVAPFNVLEDQFVEWSKMEEGGAEDFRKSILNIIEVLNKFTSDIKEAFTDVLGDDFTGILKTITLWLKDFTESLKENQSIKNMAVAIARILANIFKILTKVGSVAAKILGSIMNFISPIVDAVSEIIVLISSAFESIVDIIGEVQFLDRLSQIIVKVINAIASALNKISQAIVKNKGTVTFAVILKMAFETVLYAINALADGIISIIEWFASLFEAGEEGSESINEFSDSLDWLYKTFDKISKPFKEMIGYFKSLDIKSGVLTGIGAIANAGKMIWESIQSGFGKVIEWFSDENVKEYFVNLRKTLTSIGTFLLDFVKTIFKPLVDGVNEKDPGKVIKFILGLVGILYALKVLWDLSMIAYSSKKVLASIADAFWAVEFRLRAGAVKSIASTVAIISGSIVALVIALGMVVQTIHYFSAGEVVGAMAIIMIFLKSIISIIVIMAVLSKKLTFRMMGFGFILVNFSVSLALSILAFSSALKAVKDISIGDIGKALLVLGSISVMLALIMAASRIGRFTPLAISFAKVVLSIWGLLKMAFWVLDQLGKYTDRTINNGIKVINTMIGAFVAIVAIMKIGQMINKGMAMTTLGDMALIFLGVGVIAAAASVFMLAMKDMDQEKITLAYTTFVVSCGLALAMYFILMGLSSLPMAPIKIAEAKIGGIMAAVAFSTFAMIGAIYLAAGLSPEQIELGAKRIIMLYAAIGIIAGALLVLSKIASITTKYGIIQMAAGQATSLSIGKGGLTGSGVGGTNTPIGSLILAIGVTTALLVIMLEWAANMSDNTWETGKKRIMSLVLTVATIAAILMLIGKIPFKSEGKKTIKLTSSLIIILAAISVVAFILYNIAQLPEDKIKLAAIVTGAIMLAVTLMLYALVGATKLFDKVGIGSIGKLALGVVLMAGIFASLWVLAWSLEKLGPALSNWKNNSTGKLAAILGIVTFFVALIGILTAVTGGVAIAAIAVGLAAIALFGPVLAALAWGLGLLAPVLNNFDTGSIGKLAAIVGVLIGLSLVAPIAIAGLGVIALMGPILAAFAWGLDKLGEALNKAAPGFESFGKLVKDIGWTVIDIFNAISSSINNFIKLLADIFFQALNETNAFIKKLSKTLSDFSDDDINKLYKIALALAALGGAEVINALGSLTDTVAGWFTGGSPIDKIAKSLDNLDDLKLEKFNSFLELVKELNNVTPSLRKYGDSFKDLVNDINELDINTDKYDSLVKLLKLIRPVDSVIGYQLSMQYLDTIKDLLNSNIDIEPKVTPVFDFTQFDSGLVYMKNSLGGLNSIYIAQKAQNDYNEAARTNGGTVKGVSGGNGLFVGSGITLNVTENVNDPLMAGYQTRRTIQNAILDAVKLSMGENKLLSFLSRK